MAFETVPLVDILRGGILESQHRGAIAVVDAAGKLVASAGDPGLVTFLRSSAKPFQLLQVVESGAADRFGFSPRELAVMAASHSGEDRHVEAVRGILKRIGLSEDALRCGSHLPMNPASAKKLQAAGGPIPAVYNNCSGKHAGMLASCVANGWTTDDYLDRGHPHQQAVLRILAELSGLRQDEIGLGVDGCSVPCFAMPLSHAARMFAQWADAARVRPTPPARAGAPVPRRKALTRIAHAVLDFPEMLAGEDRFDTDLLRASKGRVVCKGGAEGYQGIGVVERPGGGPALGIAIKNADGEGRRGVSPVALESLRQLGVLEPEMLAALKKYHACSVPNHRGIEAAEVRPNFSLAFA